MEKLTLKEIAGYLPYGLKVLHIYTDELGQSEITTELESACSECLTFKDGADFYFENSDVIIKPLLYPLEMLTKPIVHNGVEVILLNEMKKKFYNVDFNDFIEFDPFSININLDSNSGVYWGLTFEEINGIIQMFYEYHFDIHGLIPRGLAIDKSTLTQQ